MLIGRVILIVLLELLCRFALETFLLVLLSHLSVFPEISKVFEIDVRCLFFTAARVVKWHNLRDGSSGSEYAYEKYCEQGLDLVRHLACEVA
jgi:hypothetical protein